VAERARQGGELRHFRLPAGGEAGKIANCDTQPVAP